MIPKLPKEKSSQENSQIMFQFFFLTKKFKERNQHYIPKTFSKCND
jgi:hypothetical protein